MGLCLMTCRSCGLYGVCPRQPSIMYEMCQYVSMLCVRIRFVWYRCWLSMKYVWYGYSPWYFMSSIVKVQVRGLVRYALCPSMRNVVRVNLNSMICGWHAYCAVLSVSSMACAHYGVCLYGVCPYGVCPYGVRQLLDVAEPRVLPGLVSSPRCLPCNQYWRDVSDTILAATHSRSPHQAITSCRCRAPAAIISAKYALRHQGLSSIQLYSVKLKAWMSLTTSELRSNIADCVYMQLIQLPSNYFYCNFLSGWISTEAHKTREKHSSKMEQ